MHAASSFTTKFLTSFSVAFVGLSLGMFVL